MKNWRIPVFRGGRFWLLEVFDGSTKREVFDRGTSVTYTKKETGYIGK